jgi:hypothetical protein
MAIVKKNPIFTLVAGACVLVFAGGCYMTFAQFGKVSKAESGVKSAQQQLSSLSNSDPAPSQYNLQASEQNVAQLSQDLESIRDNLKRGSRIEASEDGVRVMAGIQQYISEYQTKAAEHVKSTGTEEAVVVPIETPDNFAFGFERYIGEASVPANKAVIPLLDKQRQILEYLMNNLIASDPKGIKSVNREWVEVDSASSANNKAADESKTGFKISPEVSARVPGAIDTMAFRITFSGYTGSLRKFLNSLSQFDMPIVVRSVKVERAAPETANKRPAQNNNLDDIFSVFGGGSQKTETKEVEAAPKAKPIFTEIVSDFTVIVEFIDIILPSEAEEEPS